MEPQDLLFKTQDGIFSYRVAGVLVRDGMVLLQHGLNDPDFAFPGGHVNFGEVSEDALIREFQEEIAADIKPVRLLWIVENFFPWGEKDCHQICLYYLVALGDQARIPLEGSFIAQGGVLEFCWIDLSELSSITLYPSHAKDKLLDLSNHIEQFVYMDKPYHLSQ
jgi:8-oxo-dGTP pyrophosphatase MutT (NUDIX family)